MYQMAVAGLLVTLAAGSALAQTTSPPPSSDSGNRAINQPGTTNPGAPAAGANSFTESQAKSRLESRGFSNVSNLRKDDSGVWQATATKDGKQQNVSLDFQGNVVAR